MLAAVQQQRKRPDYMRHDKPAPTATFFTAVLDAVRAESSDPLSTDADEDGEGDDDGADVEVRAEDGAESPAAPRHPVVVPPLRLAPAEPWPPRRDSVAAPPRESMLSTLLNNGKWPASDDENDDVLSDVGDVNFVDELYCDSSSNDSDSEDGQDTPAPDAEAPFLQRSPRSLPRTASWFSSLKDFGARRASAQAAVKSLAATAAKKGSTLKYEAQADLAFYDEEQQKKRWRVRHDQAYFALATRLWRLVRDDGSNTLGRRGYLDLIVRFHRAISTPPLSDKKIVASALRDWEHDSEGDVVGFEGFFDAVYQLVDVWTQSSDVAEYVYFLAQLVDDVATTDPLDGSLAWRPSDAFLLKAMKRIDALAAGPLPEEALSPKQRRQRAGDADRAGFPGRIKQLRLTKRAGAKDAADADAAAGAAVVEEVRRDVSVELPTSSEGTVELPTTSTSSEDASLPTSDASASTLQKLGRSFLRRRGAPAARTPPKGGPRQRAPSHPPSAIGRAKHQRLLSAEQAQQQIAHIYQAYVSAHSSARPCTRGMPRFDLFVVLYFCQLHRTSARAKRYASAFLASVQNLLVQKDDGSPVYPRAALFARVAGIADTCPATVQRRASTAERRPPAASSRPATAVHAVVDAVMFNCRLAPDFVVPAVRLLYSDGEAKRSVSHSMRLGIGDVALIDRKVASAAFEDMLKAFSLPGLAADADVELRLLPGRAAPLPTRGDALSGDCIDVDAALWSLLKFYEKGIRYEALRRKVADRLLLSAWARTHSAAAAKNPQVPMLDLQGPPHNDDARGAVAQARSDGAADAGRAPCSREASLRQRPRAATENCRSCPQQALPAIRLSKSQCSPGSSPRSSFSPRNRLQEAIVNDVAFNSDPLSSRSL